MPILKRFKFNPFKKVPVKNKETPSQKVLDINTLFHDQKHLTYLVCSVFKTLSQYTLADAKSDFPVSIIILEKLANITIAPNLRISIKSNENTFFITYYHWKQIIKGQIIKGKIFKK